MPVRGEHCQHLQCFELSAYLQSNQKMRAFNNRWTCPLCSLTLHPSDLRHDTYVASVLKGIAADVEEVAVMADGSWKTAGTNGLHQETPANTTATSNDTAAASSTAVDLEHLE